jgi:hypothetical protein
MPDQKKDSNLATLTSCSNQMLKRKFQIALDPARFGLVVHDK